MFETSHGSLGHWKTLSAPLHTSQFISACLAHNDINLALMAVFSGFIIIRIGYFTPLLFLDSALFSIGAGLVYSLNINSPSPQYIGYQAILGIGQGTF